MWPSLTKSGLWRFSISHFSTKYVTYWILYVPVNLQGSVLSICRILWGNFVWIPRFLSLKNDFKKCHKPGFVRPGHISFLVVWEQDVSLGVCMYFWITNILMHIAFSENNCWVQFKLTHIRLTTPFTMPRQYSLYCISSLLHSTHLSQGHWILSRCCHIPTMLWSWSMVMA